MIKYSVFYPNLDGKRFDMEYYCNTYLPTVRAKLGAACKGVAVEAGLSGGEPGSEPLYIAIGHLYFDSLVAFQAAFVPHILAFRAARPNYTDIEPIRQRILLSRASTAPFGPSV
jgi:uncharacterized protein (TIGR02118 family)